MKKADGRALGLSRFIFFIIFWHVLPSTSPQIPLEMVIPPGGIDLLTSYTMPYSQGAIDWMAPCLCISTLCAMLGFFSRTSACLCALLGTYVLGVQELYGKVSRFHQHIIWFCLVFAASPCGDAFSIDGLLAAKKRITRQAVRYHRPFCYLGLILGCAYAMPAIWRIWFHGLDWALGSHFADLVHYHRENSFFVPHPMISTIESIFPFFLKMGALASLFFELFFLFCFPFQKARFLMLLLGPCFHIGIELLLGIQFHSLLCSYLILIDWTPLWEYFPLSRKLDRRKKALILQSHAKTPWQMDVLGSSLVTIVLLTGYAGVVGWPFTCFPMFVRPVREMYNYDLYLEAWQGNEEITAFHDIWDNYTKDLANRWWAFRITYVPCSNTHDLERRWTILTQSHPILRTASSLEIFWIKKPHERLGAYRPLELMCQDTIRLPLIER